MFKSHLKLILIISTLILASIATIALNSMENTDEVEANIVIIEGWLPTSAIETVIKHNYLQQYEHIITTGVDLDDQKGRGRKK